MPSKFQDFKAVITEDFTGQHTIRRSLEALNKSGRSILGLLVVVLTTDISFFLEKILCYILCLLHIQPKNYMADQEQWDL